MPQTMSCFRRHTSRVEAEESVYAFWSCDGREGLSRVRDLSPSGLFMESPVEEHLGALVTLHFLAGEGQIRASAEVRHAKRGKGVGLKSIAINPQDCHPLEALGTRKSCLLQSSSTQDIWSGTGVFGSHRGKDYEVARRFECGSRGQRTLPDSPQSMSL